MNKKIGIVILILLFGQKFSFAQSKEQLPEVKVIARAQEDRILLRWTLNTPLAWRKGNRYGYTLERYTISRDRKTLPTPEKLIIGQKFMPVSMMEWEGIAETSDNGAIMAQALWGESFVVEGGGGLASIINKAEEQQQRFAFGLYAADQDFEIAKKAGLGYIDTNVKPNEKYLYKVISNIPQFELETKERGVYIGIIDYEPLPEPVDFVGVFQDGNTLLSWDSKLLKNTYNSYIIERSENGSTFTRLGDIPYAAINKEKSENDRTIYIDSITNDKNYIYRIKGISSFGEIGPASNVVSGEGKKVLKYVPHLKTKHITSESDVELTWTFPEEGNKDITGFTLKRSDTDRGGYKPVVTHISPTSRKVRYTKLRATNYFKITANGKNNNQRDSFAMLVQPVDSIPPEKPVGLEGKVDSTGVVQLQWKPNTEEDLMGYRIYRGNLQHEEYSQLTESPHKNYTFTDTVKVKSLNTKVYYRIIAVDQRYNKSEPSEILELIKPDVIPPTAPVFTSYTIKDGVVLLEWANSSSEDVEAHYIYRKGKDDLDWSLIFQSEKFKNTTYNDTKVEEGKYYSYTILARDQSGLESTPAPPVSVVIPKTTLKSVIKGFYGSVNENEKTIELSWRYKNPNVSELELYRAVNEKPSSLYRILPPGTKRFIDTGLTINSNYTYIIRAVFNDGTYSRYTTIKIKY
ncbi:hypothetical protein ATO12_10775 [Aquimarina atlantica]|uniref:Fibronectin type-III domain-containing protein n=1 Tax=Aquimarina atlantica TaxID=1317122 RepID=A0A023BMP1_9FLAO|nr:hypothetical protein [Aquimarina atlantica]EZH71327.1 hypothetical protein ATO12_10775 [Aquimarina atlantica]